MLRLYLDYNDGASRIPCPLCRRFLVFAVQKMGRWIVAYKNGFAIRPGTRAMLVCPAYDCSHREDVEVARTVDDAVPFAPNFAALYYQQEQGYWDRSLDEIGAEIQRLSTLYQETGNPKLPCAIRMWHERYDYLAYMVQDYLRKSHDQGSLIKCTSRGGSVTGRVTALLHDAVLLQQEGETGPVLLRVGDVNGVTTIWQGTRRPLRFDFGADSENKAPDVYVKHNLPTRQVEIEGRTLILDSVTGYDYVRVHTEDPDAARALDFWSPHMKVHCGEFPSFMVDRCFRIIRHAMVQGYRLYVESGTSHPAYLKLTTRDMAVARALKMRRESTFFVTRHNPPLRWWKIFHTDEISSLEETLVPVRLPRLRRPWLRRW